MCLRGHLEGAYVDVTLESASRQTTVIEAIVGRPNNFRSGPVTGSSGTWYSKARTFRLSAAQRSIGLSLLMPRWSIGWPAWLTRIATVVPGSVARAVSARRFSAAEHALSAVVTTTIATSALRGFGISVFETNGDV